MKRFLKILTIVLVSILIFFLLLSVSVKVFEDNIAKATAKQVSKRIDAPIEIGSVDFNLFRGFPKSTIEFTDLWLKSPDIDSNDTIAGIKHLHLSVNARSAIQGHYEVDKIEVDGLAFNYAIDPDSLTNVDFLMSLIPESDSTTENVDNPSDSALLYFNLQQLLLKNISCSYSDSTSNTSAKIKVPEILLKGNIQGDNYTAETNGSISITNVSYGDYNLDLMQKATLEFHLHYNADSVRINKFSFETDGMSISATGLANIDENVNIDAVIDGGRIDLGILSSYIPQEMMQEIGLISAQGTLAFNTNITGEYNDSIMPRVDASFSFVDGAIRTSDYPSIQHLSFAGKASNGSQRNNRTTSLDLHSLKVNTPSSTLDLKAHISNIDQPNYTINTKGSVLIDEFTDFLPEGGVESISGRLDWDLNTSGTMPAEIDDDFNDYVLARTTVLVSVHNLNTVVDSSLSIKNLSGSLKYKPNNIVVENLNIDVPNYDISLSNTSTNITTNGLLSDIDNMECHIKALHLESGKNTLDMSASVSNLTNPNYTFDGQIKLDLEELQKFAPDTLINAMEGEIFAQINSAGYIHLDSIESQAEQLAFENTTINLECSDVNVDLTDTLLEISDLNIDMNMNPDTIAIDNFSGNYKGLTFGINSTKIINAYKSAYLNQKEQLTVLTSINIGDIDYTLLEPFMTETDTSATEDTTITNYTMDIKGDIAISSFSIADYKVDSTMTIKHLDLDNISSKFRVTDSAYIADSFEFNAFGGYMLTSARYDLKPDGRSVVALKNHIDGMDFKQVLYDMDNFGQVDLTHENISGELLSEINAELTMYGDSIPLNKTKMKGDFTLTNGTIKDFAPLQDIRFFTKVNDLENIKFQTLHTNLFLLNGAAYVPKTEIINSAMDIGVFGMQSIEEDEYEYHIKLKLSEAVKKKNPDMVKAPQAKRKTDLEVDKSATNIIYEKVDGKVNSGLDNKESMDLMLKKVRLKERFLDLGFNPIRINYDTNDVTPEAKIEE